MHNLNYQQ